MKKGFAQIFIIGIIASLAILGTVALAKKTGLKISGLGTNVGGVSLPTIEIQAPVKDIEDCLKLQDEHSQQISWTKTYFDFIIPDAYALSPPAPKLKAIVFE